MTRQELLSQLCGLIQSIEELESIAATTQCICYANAPGVPYDVNERTLEYITLAVCDQLAKRNAKDEIKEAFDNFSINDYGYCKPDPTI